jgi:predicted nucleic-acid-binding Zn-ribbon protein
MSEPNIKYCPKCGRRMNEGPLHTLPALEDRQPNKQSAVFSLDRAFVVQPFRCNHCNYVELYSRGTEEK